MDNPLGIIAQGRIDNPHRFFILTPSVRLYYTSITVTDPNQDRSISKLWKVGFCALFTWPAFRALEDYHYAGIGAFMSDGTYCITCTGTQFFHLRRFPSAAAPCAIRQSQSGIYSVRLRSSAEGICGRMITKRQGEREGASHLFPACINRRGARRAPHYWP